MSLLGISMIDLYLLFELWRIYNFTLPPRLDELGPAAKKEGVRALYELVDH